jgi:hypothetical protein
MGSAAIWSMCSLGVAIAIIWQRYFPDYSHIQSGKVALALYARPSILDFLYFLGLLSEPVSGKINN